MNKGFSLVEVALVVIIGGILLGSAFAALQTYMRNTEMRTTKTKLDQIDEALQIYLSTNGVYPCPAPVNEPIDTANFGRAPASCPGGPGGVQEGDLPVRTLDLPDDYISDAWGYRFRYGVTSVLTDPTGFEPGGGAVLINDSGGFPVANDAHYVIVSHGPDGAGGTPTASTTALPCVAANVDGANCDNDGTYVSTTLRSTAAANYYDDVLRFRTITETIQIPTGAVMAFVDRTSCPQGWSEFEDGQGRIVIGAEPSPAVSYPLEVAPNDLTTGGSDTVDTVTDVGLDVEEMHFIVASDPAAPPVLAGAEMATTEVVIPEADGTGLEGVRTNFNVVPRYVVLLYCRKS